MYRKEKPINEAEEAVEFNENKLKLICEILSHRGDIGRATYYILK